MKPPSVVLLLLAGLLFCQAPEEGGVLSANLFLSGVNRYLWRGRNLHDNMALQPGAEVSRKYLTIGFWGTVNFLEDSTRGFREADGYVSYDRPLPFCERLALSAGYNLYTYPRTYDVENRAVDHEFSLGLAADVVAFPYVLYYLSPTDRFDGLQAQYVELGAGHDFEIKENFTVGFSAGAGYALARTGDRWEGRASVLGLSVSSAYVTVVEISPVYFYQIPLSKPYDPAFYLGLTVSYGFEF